MIVRVVEKPSAPARIASRTSAAMAATSAGVASALAPPRSPITYARTAPCGTKALTSSTRGSRSSSSRYSGNVSQFHVMPSASAVPGMSSTPSMSWISHAWRSGRAGAKPTPQLPITTVVTPCQLDGDTSGSQVAWPS
jgi:hypothetical protein